jgi:hypothetical protein
MKLNNLTQKIGINGLRGMETLNHKSNLDIMSGRRKVVAAVRLRTHSNDRRADTDPERRDTSRRALHPLSN